MTSERTMHVQVITSRTGGGAEFLARELCTRIAASGLLSQAIYFGTRPDEELGAAEYSLGLSPRNPMAILALRKKLKRLARAHRKLVVHAHLTWPFLYVAIATLGLNVRLVYTEHNTTNKRRGVPGARWLDRLLYQRYDRIICISKGVYEALAQWVGPAVRPRLVMVPNGSRLFELKPRSLQAQERLRLVSVGSLTHKKGYEVALEAVAQSGGAVESYTIIGEGPERPTLEARIRDLNIESTVRLAGWTDDIQAALHEAHIQLIPSRWEGFGLVAVEGMSSGLPIIASDVDGLREVLDPQNPAVRLIANHRDPEQWLIAIESVAGALRQEFPLHHASRTQAEKFSLETMVDGYLAIYRELK